MDEFGVPRRPDPEIEKFRRHAPMEEGILEVNEQVEHFGRADEGSVRESLREERRVRAGQYHKFPAQAQRCGDGF
ncbi:MAG TPA: hypothetical protein VMT64_05085, partial [Candidatus Binataceae bacterium]|nr:hypothetical protein [Candidatus Binataceae bacterium]